MFKLIYVHIHSRDLFLASREYDNFNNKGEILHPESWKKVLVVFGFIKINL